jgi:adenine-specific DNA-methyltransferase
MSAARETVDMARIVATDAVQGNGHPYLSRQLIAYLGNKRRLLPFFRDVFADLVQQLPVSAGEGPPGFIDAFAGSGAVSRLAKLMGFRVAANDWEAYAQVLNSAFIGLNASQLSRLFGEVGGMSAVLEELNSLGSCSEAPFEPYVSRHFAPAHTESADYRRERLFYTAENARFLDRIRSEIERRYPEPLPIADAAGGTVPAQWRRNDQEKVLLLALLIVEASVHANTSGVFKAYHKGFGGHGGDALTRILGAMKLEQPELADGAASAEVAGVDAAEFLREHSGDIVYLDPPYNSHQYGSNYFMLNSIARWDRPSVPTARTGAGALRHKAGIREDWRNTRSAFCYEAEALDAFRELLDVVDCRHLVLSYNTEGVVPLEQLLDLLEQRGRVRLYGRDYVTYRGGRQSLHRRTGNTEFLLVMTSKERPGRGDRLEIERFLRRGRLERLLGAVHHPGRIAARFDSGEWLELNDGVPGPEPVSPANGTTRKKSPAAEVTGFLAIDPRYADSPYGDRGIRLELLEGHRIRLAEVDAAELPDHAARRLEAQLQDTACRSRREEAHVLSEVLQRPGLSLRRRRRLVATLLKAVRKFAHAKYAAEFRDTVAELRETARHRPEHTPGLEEGLEDLLELFRRRTGTAGDEGA